MTPNGTSKAAVASAYRERYGEDPEFLVVAPGRVNLIGEHTDYSHLPVLPIAIDRRLIVAAGPSPDRHVEGWSVAFPDPARLPLVSDPEGGGSGTEGWHRYLLGAVQSLEAGQRPTGVRLIVGGDLPSVGGLSSSSALTLGLIAALAAVWRQPLEGADLVARAVAAERLVGVESGGMDQNVIAHAQEGYAVRIDFGPTSIEAVPLPEEAVWIAASSGVEAPKGGRVRQHYNDRVLGTRLAAALLSEQLESAARSEPELLRLKRFANDMGRNAVSGLPVESSASAVSRCTGFAEADLVAATRGRFDAERLVAVRDVAGHVLEEAGRVDDAQRALHDADLVAMGRLLDLSHASLGRFGATTPELDGLCSSMRAAGALGARLTGAGFGGFALALCRPEAAREVLEAGQNFAGGPAFVARASAGLSVSDT